MTLKMTGAALVLLASVLFGRMKIGEERRKMALLEGTAELVRAVRDGITHYRKPLGEIFAEVSIAPLEENGFLPLCRSEGIRAAWEKTPVKLPGRAEEIMADFAARIGSGYREDELALCGYTIEQLDGICAEGYAEKADREKLYRNLPPLAALSAVLLML